MSSDDLAPGEWRVAEFPGGWELRVRFNVPRSVVLPRYLRRNVPYMIAGPVVWLIIFGVFVVGASLPLVLIPLFAPLVLLASAVFTLIIWPLRFGRTGGYRVREDGTHDHNYYRLRYSELKQTVVAHMEHGRLEVAGSVFSPHHLASLRIVELDDSFPGLVGLSFSGDVVSEQMLVPWPGVNVTTATQIRDLLLQRIEDAGAFGQDANKGFNLTSAASEVV